MSNRSERTFKILIYESEYRQIQAWTNKFENLETGGDLFGLWKDERTAMVQLVLGPGKRCRRRSTSFYQDVEYLRRMGDTLTSEEGLCHIGEWHSHHTLSLTRPSGGDESTIWSNMDRYGLSRFVLCIANICTTWRWSYLSYLPDETTVNGFLFEVTQQGQYHGCLPVLQGEFIFLHEESPFRSKYLSKIRNGAESLNTAEDQLRVIVKKYHQMEAERKKVGQSLETSVVEEQKARKEAANLQRSLTAEKTAKKEIEKTLNTVMQQAHQLQSSLSAQTQAREETERQLYNSVQQAQQLQSSLAAQTQAREDAERRLDISVQQAHQLQSCLAEQTQAREETERQLCNSVQQAHQLQSSLSAQTQAREDAERQLDNIMQQSPRLYENVQRRIRELETSLIAERKAREETETRLRRSERNAHELKTSLASQTQAREETERSLHSSEQRARGLETSLIAERQARGDLKVALPDEQKAHTAIRRPLTRSSKLPNTINATTVKTDIEEYPSAQNKSSDCMLRPNEITLSQTVITEGFWARIVEGKFGEHKVAVTKIHPNLSILSPEHRNLFEKEMEMAFQCHHPCLLQFIGATNDDQSPLLVTELLEPSLRAVLQERPLEPTEIATIALDVAEGLNYLHLKSPAPIIHRNVSSANVLLWRNGNADWRAKVSNCITDNFLQQSMAVSPFDVSYAAPETRVVFSPKVDVYSFGVLFCEMNIRELPDEENRDKQLEKVPYQYRMLVTRCYRPPVIRPTMAENIKEIKSANPINELFI